MRHMDSTQRASIKLIWYRLITRVDPGLFSSIENSKEVKFLKVVLWIHLNRFCFFKLKKRYYKRSQERDVLKLTMKWKEIKLKKGEFWKQNLSLHSSPLVFERKKKQKSVYPNKQFYFKFFCRYSRKEKKKRVERLKRYSNIFALCTRWFSLLYNLSLPAAHIYRNMQLF